MKSKNTVLSLILVHRKLQAAGNDMEKIWQVINGLMGHTKNSTKYAPTKLLFNGSQLITDEHISEGLNEFYTTMAEELAKQLPKSQVNFQEICSNQSVFLYRCVEAELAEIIKSLGTSLSTGPCRIHAKDIKEIFPVIKNY